MFNLLEKLYHLINRTLLIDITQVLYLPTSQIHPPRSPEKDYQFCCLSKEDVLTFSQFKDSQLTPNMAELVDNKTVVCIAALINESNEKNETRTLAAYSWFATGQVDAQHNSAGGRFKGIALSLPDNTHYLFKAFVLPKHRGLALNHWIIFNAANELLQQPCEAIITTTEWTNRAFLKSATRAGFRKLAFAVECACLGRHYYKIPDIAETKVRLSRSLSLP